MAYEPLHHKYRPQTFGQLVGQQAIATTLINALRQERIAPAYLFAGPRGTGKTSSARILAKSLNCLSSDRPTEEPCGVCEVCRAIANGSALDVVEIDAASNTGVDNIRELIERAQFAPVQCRYKVYTIDECHMLSNAAFNSLLKTLEEPPDRVVFVLATTDPQRVLPTIISRCQRFDFRRIPLDDMVGHLQTIAANEAIAIAPEAVTLVAQIAQGGLRDAESLLDQLSLLPEGVSVDAVWDLVGAVPERDLLALAEAIAHDHPEALIDCARRLMDRGREPLMVLQNLASFYRDLLVAKTAPARSDLVALTPPTWERLCTFVQKLDLGTILQGQQHLKASEVQLKNSTQPRLWLEVTLLGLLPSALPSVSPPVSPRSREATTGSMAAVSRPAAAVTPPPLTAPSPLPVPAPTPAPIAPAPPIAPMAPGEATDQLAALLADLCDRQMIGIENEDIQALVVTIAKEAQTNPDFATQMLAAVQGMLQGRGGPGKPSGNGAAIAPERSPMAPEPVPTPMPAAISAPVPSPEPVAAPSPYDLAAIWQAIVPQIQPHSTKVLIEQMTRLQSFDGATAIVAVKGENWMPQIEKKRPALEAALSNHCGRPVRVRMQIGGTEGSATNGNGSSANATLAALPTRSPVPAPPTAPVQAVAPAVAPVAAPARPMADSAGTIAPSPPPPPAPAIAPHPRPVQPSPVQSSPGPTKSGPATGPDDEVSRAARNLAGLFNGEVVHFPDDGGDPVPF
jgi:DNA polymerase-3 subunit gamma/tau